MVSMNVTIDVIYCKSKVLKNNENPLMLRVTKDRKRKYLSLDVGLISSKTIETNWII